MSRLTVTILIIISILAFPYWIYLPVLVAAVLFLPFYWEGIIFTLLIEVLYGGHGHTSISLSFPLAIGMSILVLVLVPIKERLRIHA